MGVYGVGGQVKSLLPLDPRMPIVVYSGTRFSAAGPQSNMVSCGPGMLQPSMTELGVYQFKALNCPYAASGSLQAASLDANLPIPENADRFRGVSPVSEDVQKLLAYIEYPEQQGADSEDSVTEVGLIERAATTLIDRAVSQESKGRGFPDDPKAYFFFHQQVRQAAVWAVTDDLTAKDLPARLPSITDYHARVAAKILNLAEIPQRLGVEPISLKELTVDELFKINAAGPKQSFLARVPPESLAAGLKRSLPEASSQEKEMLAAALKTTVAELPNKAKEILALAQTKLGESEKGLSTVKEFLKDLGTREKKASDATKMALDDIVVNDKETLKAVFDILGVDLYNLAVANVFVRELNSEERAALVTAEKVVSLDQADKTFIKDMSGDERADVETKRKNLELTLLLLTLVRDPLDQVIEDGITKLGEARYLAALGHRRAVSFGSDIEATVPNFRQWRPGTNRWEGVYYVDKNQKLIPWKLDNRLSVVSDPPPLRLGEARSVSTTPDEDGTLLPTVGSRMGRKVVPLLKPLGQFVEVTVRFRNAGQKAATVQFCTPTSPYAGAYMMLNNGIAVSPVDFVLAGVGLAQDTAETVKELTLVSELSLSAAGSLGFTLGSEQETCALFLFDVPRNATRFQLVIMGKTVDLGLPIDSTAFEPVDDKMIP